MTNGNDYNAPQAEKTLALLERIAQLKVQYGAKNAKEWADGVKRSRAEHDARTQKARKVTTANVGSRG